MKYLRHFKKTDILSSKENDLLGWKERLYMDYIKKFGNTITEHGKAAADKAKEMADVVGLKSQIASCEDVIKKNYAEIGRMYYEQHMDDADAEFEKQCTAITNAKKGIEDLQKKIREVKGV